MAGQTYITPNNTVPVLVRLASPEFERLCTLVFKRYPEFEWASFARFGWRATESGLVLTLAHVETPNLEDLDEEVGHVAINEPYTLRVALAAENHPLAVGVIHSHPENCVPRPSYIDDDMDGYYAKEFQQYGKGQPYMSLIFARDRNGSFYFTGRVFDGGDWYPVTDIFTVGDQLERDPCQVRDSLPGAEDETGGENSLTPESTTARLESLPI